MNKIVIADDSLFIQQKVKNELKQLIDTEFITISSGDLVLPTVKQHNPKCIILDIMMPQMNGFEVLSQIQANNINIPVIIFTADKQPKTLQTCLELGAFKVLYKPDGLSVMFSIVSQLINN